MEVTKMYRNCFPSGGAHDDRERVMPRCDGAPRFLAKSRSSTNRAKFSLSSWPREYLVTWGGRQRHRRLEEGGWLWHAASTEDRIFITFHSIRTAVRILRSTWPLPLTVKIWSPYRLRTDSNYSPWTMNDRLVSSFLLEILSDTDLTAFTTLYLNI